MKHPGTAFKHRGGSMTPHRTLIAALFLLATPCVASVADPADASWFTATQVADKTWRIDDHGADNLYLVVGEEKALLIDTGLGGADIVSLVRTLTDLPVVVVNTHGHPDHAGGNSQFAEAYAGEKDFDLIRRFSSREEGGAGGPPVPDEWRYAGPTHETVLVPVGQGDVFDLGGRQLEVIDVPGHTPGGICLLDRKHKLLFSGDNNNPQEWMFLEHSRPLEVYLQTLQALEARGDEFDTLLPGHGGALDVAFIGEQIQCVRNILDGTCKGEPHHTFAGDGRLCRFERAAIVFNPENLR
jgi:hydroxyacylglutathione hydrolase